MEQAVRFSRGLHDALPQAAAAVNITNNGTRLSRAGSPEAAVSVHFPACHGGGVQCAVLVFSVFLLLFSVTVCVAA